MLGPVYSMLAVFHVERQIYDVVKVKVAFCFVLFTVFTGITGIDKAS